MDWIVNMLCVGIGGALGSVGRFLVNRAAIAWFPQAWVPLGTLTVNAVGCFAVGYLAGALRPADTRLSLFLLVGVLGGFTTFSTFGHESLELLKGPQWIRAFVNIGANVGLGLIAVALGVLIGRPGDS